MNFHQDLHKLGHPRRYLRRFGPGIEIEENGDKSIPNVSPFDITWLRSGIRFYQRREWKWIISELVGEKGSEQNALKMEKRLGERSKRGRREKLMPRVAL